MKFICTQENLFKGMSAVSPLAGRNTQLPILQYVLMEVEGGILHLTCTDLEVGAHVGVGGKAEAEGKCTVLARRFLSYVQQLPATTPIVLEKKKNKLTVATKRFSSSFPIAKADDFPILPTPQKEEVVSIDGKLFHQALSNTVFAAAKDETRPEIYSVRVHGDKPTICLAATDSFRLAEYQIKTQEEGRFTFLLPVAAAQEVSRLFSGSERVELLIQKNYVVFRGGSVYLSSRLIEGSYPNYQQIIPDSFTTKGKVDTYELARALKVLSVFLPRESRRVSLSVQPAKKKLVAQVEGGEAGQGRVVVGFKGEGEDIEAVFNIQYLLEGVQHLQDNQCQLKLKGASDPLVLSPADNRTRQLYLVMPIQV